MTAMPLQEMGSLYVRGYAYQPSHSLADLEWFPQLKTFSFAPLTDLLVPTGFKVYQVSCTCTALRAVALRVADVVRG